MKKLFFIALVTGLLFSCTKKCGECFVVEYEADGVTAKNVTQLGEYCGSDARVQAGEDATEQGITCKNCQVDCE